MLGLILCTAASRNVTTHRSELVSAKCDDLPSDYATKCADQLVHQGDWFDVAKDCDILVGETIGTTCSNFLHYCGQTTNTKKNYCFCGCRLGNGLIIVIAVVAFLVIVTIIVMLAVFCCKCCKH